MEEKTAERVLQEEKLYTDGIIIDEPGTIEDSFMKKEYRQTGRLICDIIRDSEAAKSRKELDGRNVNNVISFIGSRGAGKTSVMLSVLNFLRRDKQSKNVQSFFSSEGLTNSLDDVLFIDLKYIDASVLKASEDVMSIILARMFRYMRKLMDPPNGDSRFDQEETRNLFRRFEQVYESVMTLNDKRPLLEGESALRRLQSLNSSFSLAESFRELVDCFLKCAAQCQGNSGQKAYLVIALDDVDRYMPGHYEREQEKQEKSVYTLLGQVEEYLKIPGIIVLMTYDEELLKHNCSWHIRKKFHLDNEPEIVDAQTEQYLTKVISNRHKIYMPNLGWADRPGSSQLRIKLNEKDPLFPECQEKWVTAKELTFCYLAEYYGCYFDAKGQKKHFFEEQNLRRLTDLVLMLKMTPQEKEEDNGYTKLMSYVYNPFKNFYLTAEEAHLFDNWMEKPIGRRSRDILEYIRIKRGSGGGMFSRKRLNEDGWGYSYGELLFNLYRSTREEEGTRDHLIFSKGMIKCILASYSIVLPRLVRENDREALKEVLGTSISGHWANSIMPTLFTYQYEHREKESAEAAYEQSDQLSIIGNNERGMISSAQGKAGALNVKGNLSSIIFLKANGLNPGNKETIDDKTFIQAVELLGMFFTNIQSEGRIHDYALTYDPAGGFLSTEADSACFNILNFVLNSFSWEEYFEQLHKSLVNVLMCRKYELPSTLLFPEDHRDYMKYRRKMWMLIERYSLKREYQKWANENDACALPFQHFDMMYNIMKRQQDDRPHGLKVEAEPKDFLNCCRIVYKNLAEALRKQDDFYNKCCSAENRREFEEIFQTCPFVKHVTGELNPATRLLEDWMTQVVQNMTLSVSTVGRTLLENRK